MRLYYGKKIGQSSAELMLAVFFSFFMHAAIVAAALFIALAVSPKVYVPPFYEVKLVGQPAGEAVAAGPAPPLAPPVAEKAKPKTRKSAPRPPKAALNKGALPELSRKPTKPSLPEQTEPQTTPTEQATAPSTTAPGKSGARAEGVAVSSSSEDFKFPYYMARITDNINRNWNPPPGARGMKAKVQFTVNRSGMISGQPNLQESSGNFYFDQAAVRAIQQSNPFPPMPEEFYKQTATFSVDLMPKD
jgi:periplasmic protein TonB